MQEDLLALVEGALREDVGAGDVTTLATVPEGALAQGVIIQKQPGVIYGLRARRAGLRAAGRRGRDRARRAGGRVARGRGGAAPAGAARARCSTGERTALNFLAHLSGVATAAARAARELEGTAGAGARHAQDDPRAAGAREGARSAAGGAHNHRAGLYDADPDQGEPHRRRGRDRRRRSSACARPHRSWRGRSRSRFATPTRSSRRSPRARRGCCSTTWTMQQLRAAVAQVAGRAELEASGGVTLADAPGGAATGVEWISMGALTHSAPALDPLRCT